MIHRMLGDVETAEGDAFYQNWPYSNSKQRIGQGD